MQDFNYGEDAGMFREPLSMLRAPAGKPMTAPTFPVARLASRDVVVSGRRPALGVHEQLWRLVTPARA